MACFLSDTQCVSHSVSLSVWLFGHFFTIGMWTMTFEQFMINRCHLITLDLYQSIIICYEYSNNNQQLHTCLLCWSITNLLTISMTVADGGGGWIEWIDCKLKIYRSLDPTEETIKLNVQWWRKTHIKSCPTFNHHHNNNNTVLVVVLASIINCWWFI